MKSRLFSSAMVAWVIGLGLLIPLLRAQGAPPPPDSRQELLRKRQEWFYEQRAYPLGHIPAAARIQALKELDRMVEAEGRLSKQAADAAIPASATQWTSIGPRPIGAGSVPLPITLGGASLRFNNTVAVPLFFASSGQMNVQIPWELAGQNQASLTVTVGGVSSNPVTISLAPAAPGIFTTNQSGTGQGAVLVSTGEFAAPANSIPGVLTRPARRGEFITIYCTGLGAVTNRPASGAAAPSSPLSTTLSTTTVTIGGLPAAVAFAGLSPGFVGLYQVNAEIPAIAPSGSAVSLALSVGGAPSNTVTIAINKWNSPLACLTPAPARATVGTESVRTRRQ